MVQVGDDLPEIRREITQEKIGSYAKVAGDYNPIHLDEAYAETTQFGGRIAHGMLVAATISELMTSAFRKDWIETGKLKIRLRAPVYPGDTIIVTGMVKNTKEIDGQTLITCGVDITREALGQVSITGEASLLVTNKPEHDNT